MKLQGIIKQWSIIGLVGAMSMAASYAVPSKYGSPGTANATTYSFTALGDGDITAYFIGETAGHGSMVGLSVNGAAPTSYHLQNHATAFGGSAVLGTVSSGDVIRFLLSVDTGDGAGPANPFSPDYFLNSDASLNPSSDNYIYSSPYGGDATLPAGTYVGFEDILPLANGDLDYDDHEFLFTGPGLNNVPEGGASVALLGLGLAGLVGYGRKSRDRR